MGRALIRTAAVATLMALPAVAQAAASPAGIWQIEMGDSRYRVELCGDGTALCGTLVWLGNGADNKDNLPYLNTLLVTAAQAGPEQWRGELHVYGQSAAGTITQVSDDQLSVRGCILLVICRTYQLYRYGD
ncbi:MAG: DUF2147 domain-containing protein [Cypionkella sp.]